MSSSIYLPSSSSWEVEKNKILKEAKGSALAGLSKTASFMMRDQDPYPSPYLNLSDYQIPRTMIEIFKWCRYFYKFDSLIGGAVNALARFPVTDVILEDMQSLPGGWDPKQDSPTLEMYKQNFEDMKVHGELVKIGIDYWLYGNCFIFGEFADFSEDPSIPDIRWKHIFRLDPSKMTIDIDPLTQEKTYKWEVPHKIRRICREKKPKEKFDAIPETIKKAVKENKTVILNSKNVYHFSREGESGDGSVWGTPIILNVMKQLAYRNLLRQAQEAIAREHIVPFRVYYLDPTERVDPMANWSNVASDFARQLEQATKDPNYKVVSPVPVNVINLGGQGRALMLTPEIDQLQAEILAGMGVPREFIFGGVSYSAASISLRTLENQFINYRLLLVDFQNNFLIKRMAEARGEWRGPQDNSFLITAKLADLKMQDDIQQKQLVINLNAANKVSDEYMYNMMGMDPDKMKVQIEVEIFERMDRERRMQFYQMETQFMLQQQQMQFQIQQQAQFGNPEQEEQQKAQKEEQKGEVEHQKNLASAKEEGKADGQAKAEKKHGAPVNKEKKDVKKVAFPYAEALNKEATAHRSIYDIVPGLPQELVRYQVTPAMETQTQAIINKLAHLTEEAQMEVLSYLPDHLKAHILDRLNKEGSSNPGTIAGSSSFVIKAGNMSEIEKLEFLKNKTGERANQANAFGAQNAAMPNPTKNPPRRQTLI